MANINLNEFLREEDDRIIMDNLVKHFEKTEKENKNFMELLIIKLPEMVISWEQPWYQRSGVLTRPLKVNQSNQVEPYLTNRFSKAESDIVETNWKRFVQVYKVPDTPHCFTNYKRVVKTFNSPLENNVYNVRLFVTAFLAQGIKRNLYQVYKHLSRKYSFTRKGTYNVQEERLVDICVKYCPEKACKVLSCVLKRETRNLYNKIEELTNGQDENIKHKRWTLKRSSKLLKYLLRHTDLSLSQLKNKRIEKDIWDKISEEMKRTSANLREYWYHRLHVQLFVEEDLKFQRLRRQILRKLYASPYQRWSDINWKELVEEFPDGCTSRFHL